MNILQNFLKINKICPFTMVMKCTQFDKHTCDSFLQIFFIMLKLNGPTYIHILARQRCFFPSQQVVRGVNQMLDSVSYSTLTMICHQIQGKAYQNFFIHFHTEPKVFFYLKLGIMSSEKPTIIQANDVSLKYLKSARLSGTRLGFKVLSNAHNFHFHL